MNNCLSKENLRARSKVPASNGQEGFQIAIPLKQKKKTEKCLNSWVLPFKTALLFIVLCLLKLCRVGLMSYCLLKIYLRYFLPLLKLYYHHKRGQSHSEKSDLYNSSVLLSYTNSICTTYNLKA